MSWSEAVVGADAESADCCACIGVLWQANDNARIMTAAKTFFTISLSLLLKVLNSTSRTKITQISQ
jgi:hypothetical protein